MTDAAITPAGDLRQAVEARLKRRHAEEMRFRLYGRTAIIVALAFLAILLGRIVTQGYSTFVDYQISVPVKLDASRIDAADPAGANYDLMVAESVLAKLGETDDEFGGKTGKVMDLMSNDLGYQLLKMVRDDPSLIGKTIEVTGPIKSDAALYFKGEIKRATPEDERKLDNQQLAWLDKLKAAGAVSSGAVSPKAWASDRIAPVITPGIARGRTWWKTVWVLDAPTPRAASRIEGGTALSAERVAMITVGMAIRARTRPPTRGDERGTASQLMNTARPSRP